MSYLPKNPANPKNPSALPTGLYVLTADVQNPDKYGRSRDWNRAAVIKKGSKLYLIPNTRFGLEEAARPWGNNITKKGSNYERIDAHWAAYEEILANLKPVETSDEEYMTLLGKDHGYAGEAEYLILALLRTGKLTRADIEAAIPTANIILNETE